MIATLRNGNYTRLWLGGLISLIGDWALNVGLPIYIFLLTGSVLALSITLLAASLPPVLFGSLAGVFVDRWDHKRTMVVTNLLLALVLPTTSRQIISPSAPVATMIAQTSRAFVDMPGSGGASTAHQAVPVRRGAMLVEACLGWAKIMRPATVCRTRVTVTSIVSPMCDLPFSTTIIVPSSR